MAKFRVGVLTGGGDTAALNATLHGIARAAEEEGGEVVGFRRGWAGPLRPGKAYEVSGSGGTTPLKDVTGEVVEGLSSADIDPRQGGSLLLSSRTNVTKISGGIDEVVERLKEMKIDYFLPIGGDDTTTVTSALTGRDTPFKTMAVPKTIDNDNGNMGPGNAFAGFEKIVNVWTPGFPSAVSRGKEFAESSLSTTYTHERVMWDEAMGRKAGFLALAMGTLGKADLVILPEREIHLEEVCEKVLEIYREKGFFYGVISEGAKDADRKDPETGKFPFIAEDTSIVDTFGHAKLGGASKVMEAKVKDYFRKKGFHAPYINGQRPEYFFRGGVPTDLDRESADGLGYHALKSLVGGTPSGHMAVLMWDGEKVAPRTMPLEDAVTIEGGKIQPRDVPIDLDDPEKGFYNPATFQATALGKRYVELLGVPEARFVYR